MRKRIRQTDSFKMALEFGNLREQYEDFLVKRDQLQKEANSIQISYNKEFGDLMLQAFEIKIACIRENRHFIGFELNKEYYDKACERIRLEQQQPQLF